jgi:hypothetical protein
VSTKAIQEQVAWTIDFLSNAKRAWADDDIVLVLQGGEVRTVILGLDAQDRDQTLADLFGKKYRAVGFITLAHTAEGDPIQTPHPFDDFKSDAATQSLLAAVVQQIIQMSQIGEQPTTLAKPKSVSTETVRKNEAARAAKRDGLLL